jgi:hypothetical protein
VLAYQADGRYQLVDRIGSKVEGEFAWPPDSAASPGMSERLLISVLHRYFLATRAGMMPEDHPDSCSS